MLLRHLRVLCWLAIVAWGPAAFGETVFELRNGDRISGLVRSENTNQVVVVTPWSQEVTIPLAFISARRQVTNLVAQAGKTNLPPSTNVVAGNGTNWVNIAHREQSTNGLHFSLSAGVNVMLNQKNTELYYGNIKMAYVGRRLRQGIDLNGDYGRADGVVTTYKVNGEYHTEYDLTKNKRAYAFNTFGAGYDSIRKIDLTYDESIGLGYKIIDRPNLMMALDSGANYQEEFFSDTTRKSFVSLRFGEIASWKINKRVSWDNKLEFYPHLDKWAAYRARIESCMSFKLTDSGAVFLNMAAIDIYDSSPAKDVKPNDFQLRSSIGVKF